MSAPLPLDSQRWAALRHGFGTAEDVPRLLEHLPRVSAEQRRELWFGLWHLLWRDGVVFDASIAAVPHIVAFAADADVEERAVALHLAAAIAAARLEGELDPGLLAPARRAVAGMAELVVRSVAEPWSADATQIFCGALAISRGHAALGGAVLALEPVVVCALCGGSHATTGWRQGTLAPLEATSES